MFDFLISCVNKDEGLEIEYTNDYLNKENCIQKIYNDYNIRINTVTRLGDNNDYFEDENLIIMLYGKVFYRFNKEVNNYPRVQVSEFADFFPDNFKDMIKIFKGNFAVILYVKSSKEVIVIIDQLCILPIYLYHQGNSFVLSSNLNQFKKMNLGYNYSVILEKVLFEYPIGVRSYINNVNTLEQGNIYHISNYKVTKTNYSCLDNILFSKFYQQFKFKEFLDIFNQSVLVRATQTENNITTLTGGFDGRSVVSTLVKYGYPLSSFSFGKHGGENTSIPLLVQNQTGIDYKPYYLEKEYEEKYIRFADEVIYWSDGNSIFERANYLYVDSKVCKLNTQIITSLLGGEILSPVSIVADVVNNNYIDIIYNCQSYDLDVLLKDMGVYQYFNSEIINSSKNELVESIEQRRKSVQEKRLKPYGYLYYYYDLLTGGFKQFFGSQIHTERGYLDNLTPMFDLDIISYLLGSNQKRRFKYPFNKTLFTKRNNRLLQSKIIHANSSDLSRIVVDRGFSPHDMLSPIRRIHVALSFLKRRRRVANSPKEFTSDIWSMIFYEFLLNKIQTDDNEIWNNREIKKHLSTYNPNCYNKNFNRFLSTYLWVNK